MVITGGATREAIDSVRFISNLSSGATAAHIAEALDQDFDVHLLMGEAYGGTASARFGSAADLKTRLQEICVEKKPWAIIHAAAVSDYTVAELEHGPRKWRGEALAQLKKLPSGAELKLTLKPTPKIVNEIKMWSPLTKLVAFKLTDTADEAQRREAVQKLLGASRADVVVHNDMSELAQRAQRNFTFYRGPQSAQLLGNLDSLVTELRKFLMP